ncbi:histidine kinase [Lysobacter sp. 2RAF19]
MSAASPQPANTLPASKPGWTLMRDFARLLLLAVGLPVLAIAALLLWQGRNTARAHFETQLAVAADMTARDLDTFLQMHRAALQLLAEQRAQDADPNDGAAWTRDFERVHRAYPAFERLAAVDARSNPVATWPAHADASGDVSRTDIDRARMTRRPFVSELHRGRTPDGPSLVTLLAPMEAQGRFAGVVAGVVRADSLPLFRDPAQTRGFEMLLLDATGTVVRATPGLAWRSGDALRGTPASNRIRALPVRGAMETVEGILRDGGDACAMKASLGSGWSLVVLVPERAIADELRHSALLMFGLLGLVLCGVLAVVWLQMQRMRRSVFDLLDHIQTFALDRAPSPESFVALPSELAPLAEAMNQFSIRCHDAYEKVNHGLQEQSHLREELERMARRLLHVQEDERRTLSRELHDDIGQAITAIKLGAMSLRSEDDADGQGKARSEEILADIIATTDQTIAKLRNLSILLRPPQLDTLGLETALRWQAETLFRSGKPQLVVRMTPLPRRPSPDVELACFRIAQEALTNIVRHSGANVVTLSLAPVDEGQALRLDVVDDGRGFDPADGAGLGQLTMRERAHQVGGMLLMQTAAGQGTRVHAVLPMEFANHVPLREHGAQAPLPTGRYRREDRD